MKITLKQWITGQLIAMGCTTESLIFPTSPEGENRPKFCNARVLEEFIYGSK
jgi:hypothetical protein